MYMLVINAFQSTGIQNVNRLLVLRHRWYQVGVLGCLEYHATGNKRSERAEWPMYRSEKF
jgi:hypothetical protein